MAELDNWIRIINLTGKTGLEKFYESSFSKPVSNIQLFHWAIDSYGDWPVIEAIIAASKKKFTDDPLNYILAVAQSKWKDAFQASSEIDKYERGVERSKNRVTRQNEELEEKLERARRTNGTG